MKNRVFLCCAITVFGLLSVACGSPKYFSQVSPSPPVSAVLPVYKQGEELLSLTETEEDARAIAELYGIELISFSYGVAVYHTEEAPDAVIARGKENGWPSLSLNGLNTVDQPS